jgi:hypothetical protein
MARPHQEDGWYIHFINILNMAAINAMVIYRVSQKARYPEETSKEISQRSYKKST